MQAGMRRLMAGKIFINYRRDVSLKDARLFRDIMRRVIFGVCIWLALCVAAHAEKRVALVIGNSAYQNTPPLVNPANDAEDIAAALTGLHFDVTLKRDLTITAFDSALDAFVTKAAGADIAFFFYAGHGLQIDKRGFMAPVDVKVETESSALRELVAIQEAVSRIEHAAKVSVIVLDACRDSPLQERLRRVMRSANRDIAPPKGLPGVSVTGSNTLVVYATVPGEVANDGAGRNSPFTASLLKHIAMPGLEIEQMFKRVTKDVMYATGGKQQPERLSRLQMELTLLAGSPPPGSVAPKQRRDLTAEERAAAANDGWINVPPNHPVAQAPVDDWQALPANHPVVGVAPKPGETFRDCPQCPEMVVIPAGSFMMGSPEEKKNGYFEETPQLQVILPKPFAAGKFTVTFDEWQSCVDRGGCQSNKKPSDEGWGTGRRPVINVSWNDAKEYLAWLSKHTGKTYRLPSEAEWEYAARAGTDTRYFWGDDIGTNNAVCIGCGSQWDVIQTAPVGSFAGNRFGLHDMHGNVWQWVEDCLNPIPDGVAGTYSCVIRVLRGGSWMVIPERLGAAIRFRYPAHVRYKDFGFRVARTL